MKKISNRQLVFIKKGIGCVCGLFCLICMLLNVFQYTSSTSIYGGEDYLTWREGVSVFSFLFNGEKEVLDANVLVLRDLFAFSYVVVWISFIVQLVSFVLLILGCFIKKSIFIKVGSSLILIGLLVLILVNFDVYELGKTIRYLSTFNVFYFLSVAIGVFGLFSTITIKEK